MITKVSREGMSHEEWLERRRRSIGGSDAGALLGLSKFNSPYALWCEKTGKIIPEDISEKEAVRLGNDLEDYVAKRWSEKTGKKVRRDNSFIYNSKYPFAHANIDRSVVGENAGLECKTTTSWEILEECRAGKYPAQWYAQVMHYMMVKNAPRWYLGVLVLGKGFFDFTIERDEAEIAALADAERGFWANVENNTPPALDGTEATQEALKAVFAESCPGGADLMAVGRHIEAYTALAGRIKELEEEQNRHRAEIMEFLGQAEGGIYGNTKVSWKSQQRRVFDRAAFEADHGPIGDQYFKVSLSRPFKVTEKK